MFKNYIDVTKKWLLEKTPNNHKIVYQMYYEYSGKKYFVDGKSVVLEYSEKELEVAKWLVKTLGGQIV